MANFFQRARSKGERVRFLPIRLGWGPALSSCWFRVHGWELPSDRVPRELTSAGCVPGYRRVFGWTFHLGRLKVKFGEMPAAEQSRRYAELQAEADEHMARTREQLNRENQQAAIERGQQQWREEAARRRGSP